MIYFAPLRLCGRKLLSAPALLAYFDRNRLTTTYSCRVTTLPRNPQRQRFVQTAALLETIVGTARSNEGPVLEALLELADSSMTYRRRYLGDLQAAAVLDLVLIDKTNPRSLVFQLLAMSDNVRHLPKRDERLEEVLALDSLAILRLTDMEDLAAPDDRGTRADLLRLLRKLAAGLVTFSNFMTERYLSHLQASRNLGGGGPVVRD